MLVWFRIERIGAQVSHLNEQLENLRRELGVSPALSPEPSERVRQIASDSKRTIEAIKTYRQESGTDLKKAKQVIEQLRAVRGDA